MLTCIFQSSTYFCTSTCTFGPKRLPTLWVLNYACRKGNMHVVYLTDVLYVENYYMLIFLYVDHFYMLRFHTCQHR